MRADSGYVSAWYLDEDDDGDCFVGCQMFFDFSEPFPERGYKRIAVKVVDVYGNESTVVRELS